MRFSTLFQLPPVPQWPRPELPRIEARAREAPSARESLPRELPDDLDARVRLVGEWQLGDG